MKHTINTAALQGIEALPVTVSAEVEGGLPSFDLLGVEEAAARDMRVRVRSAIRHAGLQFPAGRVTVAADNTAVRKDSTALDLPIALAVLGLGQACEGWLVLGELSLTGLVRPVCGALAFALLAKEQGLGVLCPEANAAECLAAGVPVRPVTDLAQCVQALQGAAPWPALQPENVPDSAHRKLCWSDVRGHSSAKRALEIAAAGGHSIVLQGTPGTGKTMLARRLPTILPPMSEQEALEATTIFSVAGLLPNRSGLLCQRPFRAPHHTASAAALIGGGSVPRPGEVSLAHNGVLFLDELPEFPRHVMESLRQPLDDGFSTVTRGRVSVKFPAKLQLVAACAPCPCGHLGEHNDRCTCSADALERHRSRLPEQLLSSFALQVRLPPLPPGILRDGPAGETSDQVRVHVVAARALQQARFGAGVTNADAPLAAFKKACPLDAACQDLLAKAADVWSLSPKAQTHAWRVAATVADYAGAERIGSDHLAEALTFRALDHN